MVFALSNAGEAVITAWLIEHHFGPGFSLVSLPRVLGLLGAAAIGAAVSGIGGTFGFVLFHGSTAPISSIWSHWFTSDALGIITVAPLMISLVSAARETPPRSEIIEGCVALATLALISEFIVSPLSMAWAIYARLEPCPVVDMDPHFIALRASNPRIRWALGLRSDKRVQTPSYATSFRYHHPDGRIIWLEETAKAEFDAEGRFLCLKGLTRDISPRKHAEEHQDMLIKELDHRVKNLLARVSVVAVATRQSSNTLDEFVASLDGRIQSMAATHSLLSQSGWLDVGLNSLIHSQLAPYARGANIRISGNDLTLAAAETQAMAMVLHELATNAAKYGALSVSDGQVSVSYERKLNEDATTALMLVWRELGGPPLTAEVQSGYGTSLIRDLVPYELGGTVDLMFAPDGLICRIEMPLERVVAANAGSVTKERGDFRYA